MILVTCALVLLVGAALAQDEGEETTVTGEIVTDPAPVEPVTDTPEPAGDDPDAAAALEALMGDPEETQPTPSPEPTEGEPEEGAPGDETGDTTESGPEEDEPSERTPDRPRETEPLPSDAAVPEVPASIEQPTRDTTTDDLSGYRHPTAPYNDYRLPETTTSRPSATSDTLGESAEPATPTDADAAKPTSPAMAIIVGLLVLVVLLVALAAILGIMGAQRTSARSTATPVVDTTGWAYLAAPNAPNISLQKDRFVIGSDANCDLRLADPKASPHHAQIDSTEDGYVLTDLHSTNGTLLNGERIGSPVTLRPGDEIQMGDIVVTFEIQQ